MRALSAIFAAAVIGASIFGHSKHLGYSNMNTSSGYNLFCDIDSTCRKMTDNEASFARTLFGDSIDYSLVNVFNGLPEDTTLTAKEERHTQAGVRYGNLYIPDNYWNNTSLEQQRIFMHEMLHIWQYQNGIPHNLSVSRSQYSYPRHLQGDFTQYGVEQQATILMNLFSDRVHFEASGRTSRSLCEVIYRHERILDPYLPSIGRTPSCTAYGS